jgi:hypothetical protein
VICIYFGSTQYYFILAFVGGGVPRPKAGERYVGLQVC